MRQRNLPAFVRRAPKTTCAEGPGAGGGGAITQTNRLAQLQPHSSLSSRAVRTPGQTCRRTVKCARESAFCTTLAWQAWGSTSMTRALDSLQTFTFTSGHAKQPSRRTSTSPFCPKSLNSRRNPTKTNYPGEVSVA